MLQEIGGGLDASLLAHALPQLGGAGLRGPREDPLERLAQHSTFAAMRADAEAHAIAPISPWVEEHAGTRFITIPADLGFPVTRERLDGLWRG